ncbi:MAG: SpoIID/LytB domain-containing protein [Tissierellia bacterium]|nr:SpoIID/LytB domain-containing protein [Tissierellia bacterium]
MKKLLYLLIILLLVSITGYAKSIQYLDIKIGKSYQPKEEIILTSESDFYLGTRENKKIQPLNTKKFTVVFEDGKIILRNGNLTIADFPHHGEMIIGSHSPIQVENTTLKYRGGMNFRINNNQLDLINRVSMEDYLKGVVPKEMSPSFPSEALKAQAVCSRSFALANQNKYQKYGYNLNDTTSSQVYRGLNVEKSSTNAAVQETENEILTYQGEVANAIFCASSGGVTAAAHEVWGGKEIPYLICHKDDYSMHPWTLKLSQEGLKNYGIGNVKDIQIVERDSSGRVQLIKILGDNGEKTISGNIFRSIYGNTIMKNTFFDIEKKENGFLLTGNGYGHGVGMSQYGAVEMAKSKKDYREILDFYFPGTKLVNK